MNEQLNLPKTKIRLMCLKCTNTFYEWSSKCQICQSKDTWGYYRQESGIINQNNLNKLNEERNA